jgi:hypothetical protein
MYRRDDHAQEIRAGQEAGIRCGRAPVDKRLDNAIRHYLLGCLFGPVLLTGLYCVVAHVVEIRLVLQHDHPPQ